LFLLFVLLGGGRGSRWYGGGLDAFGSLTDNDKQRHRQTTTQTQRPSKINKLPIPVKHRVRRRVDALHLVEHDALERQRPGRIVELVVPALLLERLLVGDALGVQHGVEVHVDEVVEVLLGVDEVVAEVVVVVVVVVVVARFLVVLRFDFWLRMVFVNKAAS
jgi:hypothetical protein